MKWRTCVKNVSQMGRNRAFSPLRHEEVATWAPWRQRSLQVIRRSPFGRHLVAMATEGLQKNKDWSPLRGRHGNHPCKWRPPSNKVGLSLMVAMATLMLQVATPSHFIGSPLMVAMATSRCKWRPLHHLLMVATC